MGLIRACIILKKDNLTQLDSFVIPPVSRSQTIDAIIEYVLRSPEFLKNIVNTEQEKINRKINGDVV